MCSASGDRDVTGRAWLFPLNAIIPSWSLSWSTRTFWSGAPARRRCCAQRASLLSDGGIRATHRRRVVRGVRRVDLSWCKRTLP